MAYSMENSIFQSIISDEKALSFKYSEILSSSANADIQSTIQYIQRCNNETMAMLLTEAKIRGYKA